MLRLFVFAALACGALSAQPPSPARWKVLFDGRDMSAWNDPRRVSPPGDAWVVEDGCLKARAHPRIVEDLFSRETFRDFELEFEWRISPGGNSGVKYRIQDALFLLDEPVKRFEDLVNLSLERPRRPRPDRGGQYVVAFEYQLIDNRRHPDAKTGPLHATGAVYDMIPPSADASRPVGEFNRSRIVLRGNHIEHWLNGVKVVDAELDSPAVAERIAHRWGKDRPVYNLLARQPRRDCPISLQNHGDEAWFRHIRIRRLD
jgi:hypothetical protein